MVTKRKTKTTAKKKATAKKTAVKKATKKRPVGRPRHFDDPKEMERLIDAYFDNCPDKHIMTLECGTEIAIDRPTITGLALYLGFCDRHSMYAYEENEKFSHTIKKARSRMALHYEKHLLSKHTSGAIFALKNFGWSDRQEIVAEVTTNEVISDEALAEKLKNLGYKK